MLRLLSALLLAHSACAIVVVTHASGRMGVSVVGQLREQLLLNPERERPPWCEASEDSLQIRAVVRSEQEAARLQLDLCGSVLRGGVLTPLLDMEKDLGIQICVCGDDADEAASLEAAFAGASCAVLLSAAHADFSSGSAPLGAPIVPGSIEAAKAASRFAGTAVNVAIPPVEGARAARRLGAEIAAAAVSPQIRHVILRSSMGVASLEAEDADAEEDKEGSLAVGRMGGAAALAVQADAEAALRARCDQKGVAYTVLRLGALVDSAGGVPLAFGQGDQQLLDRAADDDVNEPPLISRNDAARIVCHVAGEGLPSLGGATLDVAWQDRWGTTSAGTDETARAAARQDVMADAAAAVFGMAKQEEEAAAAAA